MSGKQFRTVAGWPPRASMSQTAETTTDTQQLVAIFQSPAAQMDSEVRANAFSAIYNHYCQSIWDYIYYQVDGAEPEAKDIFSQVWLIALEELDRFVYRNDTTADDPLRSWLFSCASNRIKQFYREKRAKISLDVVESFLWTKLSGDDTSYYELFAPTAPARANQVLLAITQGLSTEQKVILRLRYHGNMTFAEIGLYLNKSEGAVKVQHHRLLKKLRAQLDIHHDTN